jgi:L-ascorbate metabolism protein UlaG (beta-lactamase superfamily)
MSFGETKNILGVSVEAVPAYNTNKFRTPGKVYHPKEEGRIGYIITMNGVRIYHAGDTDHIPEMKNIKVDIALLPVSGTYVMTADEAAKAVAEIKPKIAIPMHYGAIVGDVNDAQKFQKLATCKVTILEKE